MAFESFNDFLAMGNHGFYVWLAYGLTFLILASLAWHSVSDHRSTLRELAAQRKRAQQAGGTFGNTMESTNSDSRQT